MSKFDWATIPESAMPALAGTVLRRFVHGEKLTIAQVAFATDSEVAVHTHENEQFTFVLSGTLEFTIAGEKTIVNTGEVVHILPNIPHGARSIGEAVVLDFFTPIRADWE
jgi:quercetin dioxygenase-like cupin family protein